VIDGYRDQLRAEALARPNGSLLVALVELPELEWPRRWHGPLAAAVARRLWALTWPDAERLVGRRPGGLQPQESVLRRTAPGWSDAVEVAELIAREALVDQHLAERAEVIETLELLAEVGRVERLVGDDGEVRYRARLKETCPEGSTSSSTLPNEKP